MSMCFPQTRFRCTNSLFKAKMPTHTHTHTLCWAEGQRLPDSASLGMWNSHSGYQLSVSPFSVSLIGLFSSFVYQDFCQSLFLFLSGSSDCQLFDFSCAARRFWGEGVGLVCYYRATWYQNDQNIANICILHWLAITECFERSIHTTPTDGDQCGQSPDYSTSLLRLFMTRQAANISYDRQQQGNSLIRRSVCCRLL